MIKKISIYMFLLWILFSNIMITKFKFPSYLQVWDIILEIVLIILFIINYFKKKNLEIEYQKSFVIMLLIIIVGLIGNAIFNYHYSIYAIFRDIATFLKFPLIFLILKNLNIGEKISKNIDTSFIYILKYLIIVISLCGIINLFTDINMSIGTRFGIRSFTFLFSHQTFLVITLVFILVLFEFSQDKISDLLVYEILISFLLLITMRTKAIMFMGVFWSLKLFWNNIQKHKKLSIGLLACLVIILGIHKIFLYISFSSSTREILYKGMFILALKCFPFGSGFGTFASHLSGVYRSKVYKFIKIDYVWKTNYISQLGDVGFPYYVGQFGIIGMIFIVMLAKKIISISLKDVKDKKPIYALLAYVIIGLTSESTLLNYGAEVAVILSIISSKKLIAHNK